MQDINNAFLTSRTKNDSEIEKATTRNINRIEDNDIQEIHSNLMKVMNVKSDSDSKYFQMSNFRSLVYAIRAKKKEKEEARKKTENLIYNTTN